jgi:predicted alpha/beta-hydrolase family hydrolase
MLTTPTDRWIEEAREIASRAATPPIAELQQATLRVLLCIHDALVTPGVVASSYPVSEPPKPAQRRTR